MRRHVSIAWHALCLTVLQPYLERTVFTGYRSCTRHRRMPTNSNGTGLCRSPSPSAESRPADFINHLTIAGKLGCVRTPSTTNGSHRSIRIHPTSPVCCPVSAAEQRKECESATESESFLISHRGVRANLGRMIAAPLPYQRILVCRDACWIADVPDLKPCSAHGDTPEQAIAEAQIAIEVLLPETATERGMPIPEPRYRPAIYAAA